MPRVTLDEINDPKMWSVSLCFDWMDMDSCMSFEIAVDGDITDKIAIVESLIAAWGGVCEMANGTIVNLTQFKTAYVSEIQGLSDLDEFEEDTDGKIVKLVH